MTGHEMDVRGGAFLGKGGLRTRYATAVPMMARTLTARMTVGDAVEDMLLGDGAKEELKGKEVSTTSVYPRYHCSFSAPAELAGYDIDGQ